MKAAQTALLEGQLSLDSKLCFYEYPTILSHCHTNCIVPWQCSQQQKEHVLCPGTSDLPGYKYKPTTIAR